MYRGWLARCVRLDTPLTTRLSLNLPPLFHFPFAFTHSLPLSTLLSLLTLYFPSTVPYFPFFLFVLFLFYHPVHSYIPVIFLFIIFCPFFLSVQPAFLYYTPTFFPQLFINFLLCLPNFLLNILINFPQFSPSSSYFRFSFYFPLGLNHFSSLKPQEETLTSFSSSLTFNLWILMDYSFTSCFYIPISLSLGCCQR